ncbi:MAG: hypothetical protein OXM02_08155 [Bacteroidota bacterium]|nr:hypothetical protein [Bacteroidota bacterium]MDE2834481.1 hypothetical protein [Bacteroidota bacterium]
MRSAAFLALLLFSVPAFAQDADPDDVSSIDNIIGALYEVISGPANTPRNWDRFHSLFVPDARLMPIGRDSTGAVMHRAWSPQDYQEVVRPYFDVNGFFEVEISRVQERYGNMAHAFSTYESYRNATHDDLVGRGINSIQLVRQGGRWWILTIFWQPDWPGLPVPDKYLPGEDGD